MEICKSTFLVVTLMTLAAFCRLAASLESASPEKFLLPRNYNPHPYRKTSGDGADEAEAASRFVQRFVKRQKAESGRKGPVLFPYNVPQSTNNPLIVTSRPLAEEIARRNQKSTILTPTPPTNDDNLQQIVSNAADPIPALNYAGNQNGYLAQPRTFQSLIGQHQNQDASQVGTQADYYLKQVVDPQFHRNPAGYEKPGYNLIDANGNVRVVDYKVLQILQRNGYLTLQSGYSNGTVLDQHPYAAAVRKTQQLLTSSARPPYDAVEEHTAASPLYRALDRYTKSRALGGGGEQTRPPRRRPQPESNTVDSRAGHDEYYSDNAGNGNKHYAFSYSVKDQHTGDDFSHSQRHTGSGTNGEYRVKLPDGRTQIVSYTADNGGYKADVRYQEDTEAAPKKQKAVTKDQNRNYQQAQPQNAAPTTNPNIAYFQNDQPKLGRIVVPSQEETDYQDVYYYDQEANRAKSEQAYSRYVTNDAKEVLITSRPGYLYTPSATSSPLLYKQFPYNGDDNTNDINTYTASPRAVVYLQPAGSNIEQQRNQPSRYSSTTIDPQDASRTYSHFYNAESVKFVSTTPKYPEILRNSVAAGSNRIASTAPTTLGHYLNPAKQNSGYLSVSSTVAPGLDNYDHLDTPDVVKIEPRPKTNVRYTSLAPISYSSVSDDQNNVSPTAVYAQTGGGNSNQADSLSLGRYLGSVAAIDLRKYFTFKKR